MTHEVTFACFMRSSYTFCTSVVYNRRLLVFDWMSAFLCVFISKPIPFYTCFYCGFLLFQVQLLKLAVLVCSYCK